MHLSCLFFIASFFFILWLRMCHSSDQCPSEELVYGKALKGYTLKTLHNSSTFECLYYCHHKIRCQSYNYVIKDNICEINNRTKEAKPENFVSDSERFYKKRGAPRGKIN